MIYIHSKILDKKIKFDPDKKIVYINELKKLGNKNEYVSYTMAEVKIMSETVGEITPEIHDVKNIFDGIIIKEEKKNG